MHQFLLSKTFEAETILEFAGFRLTWLELSQYKVVLDCRRFRTYACILSSLRN